jgi:hypothetical protein
VEKWGSTGHNFTDNFLILKTLMTNISRNEGTDKANPKLGVELLARPF